MGVNKYSNQPLDRTHASGAASAVSIEDNVARGAAASTPCRLCYVNGAPDNVGYVRMNVGAAATSTIGIVIPGGGLASTVSAVVSEASWPGPMAVPIDDIRKLYFWGADDDWVDILYLR